MCENEQNEKLAADYSIRRIPSVPQGECGQRIHKPMRNRPSTLREEAENKIGYHREQADRHDRAVAFLRENPAFDEFVRLVRDGVIQF
jgi:hypothetical protein